MKFIKSYHLASAIPTCSPAYPPTLLTYKLPHQTTALVDESLSGKGDKGGAGGDQGVGYGDPIARQPRDEYLNRVGAKRDTVSKVPMAAPPKPTAPQHAPSAHHAPPTPPASPVTS